MKVKITHIPSGFSLVTESIAEGINGIHNLLSLDIHRREDNEKADKFIEMLYNTIYGNSINCLHSAILIERVKEND